MKNWKMALGVLVLISVALSAVFVNLGGSPASPAQDQTSGSQPSNAPASGEKPAAPKAGFPAPDFSLRDLDGKTYTLSELKGKRVLINFWASWCGPCKMEMPDLVKASEKYKDQIVFLGINDTTTERGLEGITGFLKEFDVQYTNVMDTQGEVVKKYQVLGYPTTFTIGQDGTIVDKVPGMMTEATLEQVIQKLLKK